MYNDKMLEKNISQKPAVELFEKLGYTYISPEECVRQRKGLYGCILQDILKEQLKKINSYDYNGKTNKFSNFNIEKAVSDLDVPIQEGLVFASEKVYNIITMGRSYEEEVDGRKASFDLKYIDWNPETFLTNNVFHVTQEFSVDSDTKENHARVDIVLFVNGIPLVVIECKSAIESIDKAIEQNIRNQTVSFIPQLFKYTSLVIASNKNEVKYGTTRTNKKFYSVWNYEKDEKDFIENKVNSLKLGRVPTYQDKIFTAMLMPERLLEITRCFILFDANVKKVCRYQQFYGVKNVINTITQFNQEGNRKSGIVWHTQGSGKSLTMVMIANYILTNINPGKSKVIIVTDRKELDKQIARTFSNTKIKPTRATSGRNLIDIINEQKADVVTTIINKFNIAEKERTKNISKDIFVLVDESHRSNYGELATKMRRVFPNACFVGFTGTPLMKNDKTAMKFGGNYIHTYTIKDGVDDKMIVPLIYDGRFVEQKVDADNIDLWFKKTCRRLTEQQKDVLSRKWSSIQKLNSTNARIERIALDIDEHFTNNIKATGFKAMLATNSKLDAVRYYNAFKQFSDLEVAVCISAPDLREGYEDVDESKIPEVLNFWHDMMQEYGNNPDEYEDSIKNKFCDGDIDILIVCSKLLTGFDAPLCQVLYIDKQLKEHGLLQAIARTNRLYDGKDYGLIVDYRGLLPQLNDAIDIYSGEGGLDAFEKKDLKGLITDVLKSTSELRQAYSNLENNFADILNKGDVEEYEVLLESDDKLRQKFYNDLCEFGKKLSLVLSSENAYSAIADSNPNEITTYKDKFVFYSKLRVMVKKRCAETIDNKDYENEMRNLLDKHMSVVGLNILTKPLDIMNKGELEKEIESLGSKAAKADAIRHNLSQNISINIDSNPAYYDSFAKRIQEVLQQYKDQRISDVEYWESMTKILDDFRSNRSGLNYPENVKQNVHAQAFYGVILPIINEREYHDINIIGDIALKIVEIIKTWAKVDWENNIDIHNKIAQAIDDLFWEYEFKGIKLDYQDVEKIIENVKTVAIKRF